jgi:hypothetical protein
MVSPSLVNLPTLPANTKPVVPSGQLAHDPPIPVPTTQVERFTHFFVHNGAHSTNILSALCAIGMEDIEFPFNLVSQTLTWEMHNPLVREAAVLFLRSGLSEQQLKQLTDILLTIPPFTSEKNSSLVFECGSVARHHWTLLLKFRVCHHLPVRSLRFLPLIALSWRQSHCQSFELVQILLAALHQCYTTALIHYLQARGRLCSPLVDNKFTGLECAIVACLATRTVTTITMRGYTLPNGSSFHHFPEVIFGRYEAPQYIPCAVQFMKDIWTMHPSFVLARMCAQNGLDIRTHPELLLTSGSNIDIDKFELVSSTIGTITAALVKGITNEPSVARDDLKRKLDAIRNLAVDAFSEQMAVDVSLPPTDKQQPLLIDSSEFITAEIVVDVGMDIDGGEEEEENSGPAPKKQRRK